MLRRSCQTYWGHYLPRRCRSLPAHIHLRPVNTIHDNILDRLSDSSPWSEQKESTLLRPFTYLMSIPGKGIVGRTVNAFNIWLGVPENKLQIISRGITKLHDAALLIDDIEDGSQLRRGQPVAHTIYCVPQTINTANYACFLACQELFTLSAIGDTSSDPSDLESFPQAPSASEHNGRSRHGPMSDLVQIVITEILSIHRGQGLELSWRDSFQCPTEEDYIEMINNKTGGFFRMIVKLMMAFSTAHTRVNYVPLANLLGIYYQIRDDYVNLQSAEYSTTKGFAEDLTEGKFSFPIIHGIHANMADKSILGTLEKRPTTPTEKLHTIAYLKNETKSFSYTLGVLCKLEKQIRDEIQRLGGNSELEGIVDILHIES